MSAVHLNSESPGFEPDYSPDRSPTFHNAHCTISFSIIDKNDYEKILIKIYTIFSARGLMGKDIQYREGIMNLPTQNSEFTIYNIHCTITRISPEITFLLFRFYIVLVVAARCIVKLTNHTRYIGDIS